jgi:hypothetical protein
MFNNKIEKDERAVTVEKSSYSLAYKIVSFAVLVDVMYRSWFLNQACWDLLGIVIIGGFAATLYQTRFKIITKTWIKAYVFVAATALVIAAIIVLTQLLG